MPSRPSYGSRALFVLVATVALLGAGMPIASAHDELVATTPAQDTTVPTPPSAVTLEFSRAVQPLGAQVIVRGPIGGAVSQGAAEVEDATVVQPLTTDIPAGAYQVAWRVTSSDGHPLSGEFAFTVAGGDADPAPAATGSAGSGDDGAAVRETAADRPVSSSPPYGVIGVGVALLAAAGGLLLLRRRS